MVEMIEASPTSSITRPPRPRHPRRNQPRHQHPSTASPRLGHRRAVGREARCRGQGAKAPRDIASERRALVTSKPRHRHLALSSPPTTTNLTTLEEQVDRVINLHVAVREWGDEVVFLHRILPGKADRVLRHPRRQARGITKGRRQRKPASCWDSLSVSSSATPQVASGTLAVASPKPGQADSSLADGQLPLFTEFLPHPAIEEIKAVFIRTR